LTTAIIYLVDDEIAVLNSLRDLIESTGLKTKSFLSAAAFLKNYAPAAPGCLILDIHMPNMGGLELREELARINNQIPIIFISGSPEIPESLRAFKTEAVIFMEKPFNSQLLMANIRTAVAKNLADRQQALETRIQETDH